MPYIPLIALKAFGVITLFDLLLLAVLWLRHLQLSSRESKAEAAQKRDDSIFAAVREFDELDTARATSPEDYDRQFAYDSGIDWRSRDFDDRAVGW